MAPTPLPAQAVVRGMQEEASGGGARARAPADPGRTWLQFVMTLPSQPFFVKGRNERCLIGVSYVKLMSIYYHEAPDGSRTRKLTHNLLPQLHSPLALQF